MAEQFGAPSLENLVRGNAFAQRIGACMICGDEDVPNFALIFREFSRDGNRAAQIPLIVLPLATYIQANQISGAHDRIQVVVAGERYKGTWEHCVRTRHGPRPESDAVRARVPASIFDDSFDTALRHART